MIVKYLVFKTTEQNFDFLSTVESQLSKSLYYEIFSYPNASKNSQIHYSYIIYIQLSENLIITNLLLISHGIRINEVLL